MQPVESASIRQGRRTLVGSLLATALSAATLLSLAGTAMAGVTEPAGSLFVLNSGSGKLVKTAGPSGGLRLVLTDLSQDVTIFTDRPQRVVKHESPSALVRHWKALGFASVPPNAALAVANPNRKHRSVLIVSVENPRRLQRGHAIAFHATVLKGSPSEALQGFARRAGHRVAKHFGRASLFIDPSGPQYQLSFNLKAVSNPGLDVRFSNASIVGEDLESSGPTSLSVGSGGFVIEPKRHYPALGTPIDAFVALDVAAGGAAITGTMIRAEGMSGTLTISNELTGDQETLPLPPFNNLYPYAFSWPLPRA
jgi:hypothetical protein